MNPNIVEGTRNEKTHKNIENENPGYEIGLDEYPLCVEKKKLPLRMLSLLVSSFSLFKTFGDSHFFPTA